MIDSPLLPTGSRRGPGKKVGEQRLRRRCELVRYFRSRYALINSKISSGSGNRPASDFEKIRLPSTRTSKLWNSPGSSSTSVANSFSISSANLAAMFLYAQEVQCRITTLMLFRVSELFSPSPPSETRTAGANSPRVRISNTNLPNMDTSRWIGESRSKPGTHSTIFPFYQAMPLLRVFPNSRQFVYIITPPSRNPANSRRCCSLRSGVWTSLHRYGQSSAKPEYAVSTCAFTVCPMKSARSSCTHEAIQLIMSLSKSSQVDTGKSSTWT